MSKKNNKEFSNKQESMVADYMGWKVVAGSGARPFTPGDVFNEYFLVECKTHTEEQPNIVFYKNHWDKISEEARAKCRIPCLVVDNGTQKSQNTWVMLPVRSLPMENICTIFGLDNTSKSGNTVTFKHKNTYDIFKDCHQDDMINHFAASFGESQESLAVMPLEEFRNYYQQENTN